MKLFTRERILALLSEAPQRISGFADGLTSEQLHTAPEDDDWSVNDLLAHLRSCADVWEDAIERMLNEDRPEIRAISPVTWLKQTDYREQDFQSSLQAFTEQRAGLLRILEPLPEEAWSRSATVLSVGRSFEHTVHSYADRLARHERNHYRQLGNIVDSVRAHQPQH